VEKIDQIDLRILDQLQQDSSLAMAELADRVGLSTSPCWRRVRRMQEAGIIKGQSARLDRQKLGLNFVVYAFIKLATTTKETLDRFETIIRVWPEVVLCECMTGAADFLIKVVATDVQGYDYFLRERLLATGLVADVQSRIVVHTVKDTTRLPLVL
jgi:DNA-binding Lrp family transcriptional regulator